MLILTNKTLPLDFMKKFKKVFGEINGEKNVRLPKELQEAGEKQPLIYNKQFYVYTSFPPEIIFEEGL